MKKENYLFGNNNYLFIKKMVNHMLLLIITMCSYSLAMGQVAINDDDSDANTNTALHIQSITKGVLFPSMSTTARNNLKSPVAGLLIYNPSTNSHNYYSGTEWREITTGAAIPVTPPTSVGNEEGVGVGIDDPDNSAILQVSSTKKGFLLPQGNLLPANVEGMIFYTLGDNFIQASNGTTFAGVSNSVIVGATIGSGNEIPEGVLIGAGTIAPSAAMEVRDASKGLLIPRMNNTQRNGIVSPAEGLTIYNTESNQIQFYSTLNWYPWTMETVTPPVLSTVTLINTDTGPSGTIQTFEVPAGVTAVIIEAWGAEGSPRGGIPGKGARMKGSFNVSPGNELKIVVGQKGLSSGGGGGGSFVYNNTTNQLLIAAGGGGGSSDQPNGSGGDGLISEEGGNYTSASGAGSTGGSGGTAYGTNHMAGAGAGFLNDGENSNASIVCEGGKSWENGMFGGVTCSISYLGRSGGFGGGGAAGYGPGGGGGYSGGSTYGTGANSDRFGGGGGGSYNAGANQSNAPGVQTGHGQVFISY